MSVEKRSFGANRNDVFLRILHDTRRFGCGAHGGKRKGRNKDDDRDTAHETNCHRNEMTRFIVSLL